MQRRSRQSSTSTGGRIVERKDDRGMPSDSRLHGAASPLVWMSLLHHISRIAWHRLAWLSLAASATAFAQPDAVGLGSEPTSMTASAA